MDKNPDWNGLLDFLEPKQPLYCPHEPFLKQKVFLRYEGMEALYGGKAGGGKSDALLMAALQYVDVPGYSAILFRNTYADLALPGALMDRSHEWLDEQDGPRWLTSRATWLFPSGATITFGYLEKPNDHLRYKGMEVQFIGFDEVTEIREKQYLYLFSRLRKPKGSFALGKVPLRVRAATNPAPNWVRRRFIEEGKTNDRLYVPAGLRDNPFIDQEGYEKALQKLDPVERARLQDGDWYAEEEGAKFSRDKFKIVSPDDLPDGAFRNMVRYWDLAATEVSQSNPDPDWTAGALVSLLDGYMIIHDIRRFRRNSAGVEQGIQQTAREDGIYTKIRMEQEGGATGKMTIDHFARHVLLGYDFDGWPTKKDKEKRADPWAAKTNRGEVLLVNGPWVTSFLDEAVSFGGATAGHDDQIDAVSGAFEFLTGLGSKGQRKIEIIV